MLNTPKRDLVTQVVVAGKQEAIERLCSRHASAALSSDDIRYALASLADFNSFIESNRRPVDDMLILLESFFDPSKPDGNFSLEISSGQRGSKLSHSHATQFTFVLQTLTLWQKTTDNMFRLWILAERVRRHLLSMCSLAMHAGLRIAQQCRGDAPGADKGRWGRASGGQDLLKEDNGYRLANTGQGLNRSLPAPPAARLALVRCPLFCHSLPAACSQDLVRLPCSLPADSRIRRQGGPCDEAWRQA